MNIVFFGSDDFALVTLTKIFSSGHRLLACVTQTDKKRGRNLMLSSSVIKDFTLKQKIPLLQPETLTEKDFITQLKNLNGDIFAVVAYGKILPEAILSLPKIFCVNIHGSLLPKYRGAAPINWAIINGETKTGVSIIRMNAVMDAGDILAAKETEILPEDTAVSLRSRMAEIGADLFLKTLSAVEKKNFILTRQNEQEVSFASKLTKEHGIIDWRKDAVEIHNLIRGLLPWPTAYTSFGGKIFKILKSKPCGIDTDRFSCGQVVGVSKESFTVLTGKGGLEILEVHPESSKPMSARSFLSGYKLGIGYKFTQ